ncbi:LytTR family transcriptional regulator [Rhizobium sp. P38BS-XIX]|uniref:LytTR family DNA-binding domain-containing protein n=1 Tax=Rhizobium sp. P38BS-XIX TaxID=2726740 RepID=UPI00145772A0|nr:LytTR family DNA-binding domain-containing protein [Rhizobium sp. P38BS-XIX]NLR97501.1 LytTR family transcriptional regulator [Rhizobium sp. P38BS-XIX]
MTGIVEKALGISGRLGVIGGRLVLRAKSEPNTKLIIIIAVGIVATIPVNATSTLLEAARMHRTINSWEPVVWEVSSALIMLLLAPLTILALAVFPMKAKARLTQFAVHAGFTLPFSLAHVVGMVVLRKLAYTSFGSAYQFAQLNMPGDLARELIYEWRKDALTYAVWAAIFYALQHIKTRRGSANNSKATEGFEVREGAHRIFVYPREICWVEAAGNYVQLNTRGRSYMLRGTLGAWEAQLSSLGFLRIHRSRIINVGHVRAVHSIDGKEFAVTLENGQTIKGSRRFRGALERLTPIPS